MSASPSPSPSPSPPSPGPATPSRSGFRTTLVIARRELMERLRSRWFVAITLLGPLGMVAMIVIPSLIATSSTAGTRIDILDRTGKLGAPLVQAFTQNSWRAELGDPAATDEAERARIRSKAINGFIRIPDNGLDGGQITYQGDNASSQQVQFELRRTITTTVIRQRGERLGLDDAKLSALVLPVSFTARHTTGEAQGSSGIATFFLGYVLAMLLYMVITLYGVGVMRSVVLEKTSRVMELMVAAVKPYQLMAGKVLGVGTAGLIQLGVWMVIGAVSLYYRDAIAAAFGATGGGPNLPPLAAPEVTVVLVFFLFGYFFYASMYAALGALVSSDQDTQQVQLPLTMILLIGMLSMQVVSNDPRGSSAQAMTMLPIWSPMLMPLRYVLGGASLGDVALSLAILIISTLLVVRAAAKIYRVGVLMYGKRPSFREVLRWLRH